MEQCQRSTTTASSKYRPPERFTTSSKRRRTTTRRNPPPPAHARMNNRTIEREIPQTARKNMGTDENSPTALNPFGTSVNLSPWLIHTSNSSGRPSKRAELHPAERRVDALPYSRCSHGATLPPKTCASSYQYFRSFLYSCIFRVRCVSDDIIYFFRGDIMFLFRFEWR